MSRATCLGLHRPRMIEIQHAYREALDRSFWVGNPDVKLSAPAESC